MSLRIADVDLYDPTQAAIWLDLLDHYAQDPMGGGEGLSDYAKLHLVNTIREVPGFHGALAWKDDRAVGLIDCFAGFSTFAAKPLLNVHDIVVHASLRGQGIGQALLGWAEQRARSLGLQTDAGSAIQQYARHGVLSAGRLRALHAGPGRRACTPHAEESSGRIGMNEPVAVPDLCGVRPSLVQLTHVIYGLHEIGRAHV
jgi:GNAT superfamily N-acetyltransferase